MYRTCGLSSIAVLVVMNLATSAHAATPTYADVSYGPHPNNKLDFWQATTDKPAPLIVFIHGGGFVGGDKSKVTSRSIDECLDRGVHYASINYRFRTEVPIQDVLRDSARAIQFLRLRANDWNIDTTRVAAYGGSAGAGTSLWLAFHDDLANPSSDDPLLRQSTRLCAAGSMAGQFSYDILQWQELFSPAALKFGDSEDWPAFYGLKTMDDLHGEEGKRIRADMDVRGLITSDDPPVFLTTASPDGEPTHRGEVNHHPKHMRAIKQRCDEVGVPATLVLPEEGKGKSAGPRDGTALEFLLEKVTGS